MPASSAGNSRRRTQGSRAAVVISPYPACCQRHRARARAWATRSAMRREGSQVAPPVTNGPLVWVWLKISMRSRSGPERLVRYLARTVAGQVQVSGVSAAHRQGLAAITSWNLAGNVKVRWARWIRTWPFSMGMRSESRIFAGISDTSSRKSTPLCARLTAPGLGVPDPPPRRAAALMEWWGAM